MMPVKIHPQDARKGIGAALITAEDVVNIKGVFVSTLKAIRYRNAFHREQAVWGADLNLSLILRTIRQLAGQRNQTRIEKG